ncbi:hypothetical protein N665_0198s0041, partial [Sinapis alba]
YVAAFWFIGSWMIPFMTYISVFSKDSLTFRGQTLFSLITDVTEGLVGIAILHRCLSMLFPLPSNWFHLTLKGNWQLEVIIGCFMFPFVNHLSQLNLNIWPLPQTSSPISLSSVEQSIMAKYHVGMAPIVFRGFLLLSLTRYMPVWCVILVSSVAFALHISIPCLILLVLLGVVLGLIFARSRNLLPSMLLHSLWNSVMFMELMQ